MTKIKNGAEARLQNGGLNNLSENKNFSQPKQTVNYLQLINCIWQEVPFIDGYKGTYMTLLLAIIDSINRQKWKAAPVALETILNKIGSSRKVYTDGRKWLEMHGLLVITPGKNANQMAVFALGPVVQKWTGTCTGKDTTKPGLPVQKWTGTCTHYKTENNKPKTEDYLREREKANQKMKALYEKEEP